MSKRKGFIVDGVGYIPLTQGLVTKVDLDMVPVLERRNWCASMLGGKPYAMRGTQINGRKRSISMARFILGLEEEWDKVADHINLDTLDNRRCNLRAASWGGNATNRPKLSSNTSGYKGVTWNKQIRRWKAQIQVNRNNHHVGSFTTVEEAYAAYCKAAIKSFGEFARLE